jgi:enoyl-CoA hydratase/carnithine racemase
VIAAINGAVAGLGLVEAATCDLRFASPDAIFTLAFSRYGLTAEGGISWLLPRIVGTGRALDLLWTSKRFTGADAYRFGLVEYLSEPGNALADAHAYAARLVAQVSAYSLAKMKEQVYADWGHDRDRALEASWRLVLESLDRPEFREAARPPR